MSEIIDTINDVITEKAGQMVLSALHYQGTVRPNSVIGLVDWNAEFDPHDDLYQLEVSGNSGVGTFPEGGPYNAPGRSVTVDARQLNFGRYHVPIELSKSKLAKMQRAGNTRMKIANFLQTHLNQMGLMRMFDELEKDAIGNSRISGGDDDGIQGLVDVRSDSNTYLEISATTYSNSGAYVNDNSSTPRAMTYPLLQDVDTAITDTNGGQYDIILCTKAREKAIQDLDPSSNNVPSQQLYTHTGPDGRERTFSAGYVKTFLNGKPVIAIPGYTAGVVDFVNSAALKGNILRVESKMTEADDTVRWVIVWEGRMWVEQRDVNFASLTDLS